MQPAEHFPFKDVPIEIKGDCRIIGCFLPPLSRVLWRTTGSFRHESKKDSRNGDFVYDSTSTTSINFCFFENIAPEITDNCKVIGAHNSALNQNLEGLTRLFARIGSPSKLLFRLVDKAT
jgi:hypothetical protein